jgi:hypothetical protein
MNRIGIGAALGLLIAVNLLVLFGVARNRSGEPQSSLELTERELRFPWSREENTGLSLRLDWSMAGDWTAVPEWFGRAKLEEVGFDCSLPVDAPDALERYREVLSREAFAVLEFEGESWQAGLRNEETELETLRRDLEAGDATRVQVDKSERSLEWRRITRSRLFAVDVGHDPEKLRLMYPERSRYMILPALVRLRTDTEVVDEELVLTDIYGDVERILVGSIHVPRSHRPILDALLESEEDSRNFLRMPVSSVDDDDEPQDPRFIVLLHVGRRHEPWIGAVRTWEPSPDLLPR